MRQQTRICTSWCNWKTMTRTFIHGLKIHSIRPHVRGKTLYPQRKLSTQMRTSDTQIIASLFMFYCFRRIHFLFFYFHFIIFFSNRTFYIITVPSFITGQGTAWRTKLPYQQRPDFFYQWCLRVSRRPPGMIVIQEVLLPGQKHLLFSRLDNRRKMLIVSRPRGITKASLTECRKSQKRGAVDRNLITKKCKCFHKRTNSQMHSTILLIIQIGISCFGG